MERVEGHIDNLQCVNGRGCFGGQTARARLSSALWALCSGRNERALPDEHFVRFGHSLSGPISRDSAILSLRYPISRDTFSGRLALPRNGAIPPLGT